MVITKGETRVMTDPGGFTCSSHTQERNVNAILITHEHGDHVHTDSLKELLLHNPQAQVFTNVSTGVLLEQAGIKYEIFSNNEMIIGEIRVRGMQTEHAPIFEDITNVENTALWFDERFLYPGDAWYVPEEKVELLALPIVAPWAKTSEVINYARAVAPKKCFPVHDALLHSKNGEPFYRVAAKFIASEKTEFVDVRDGEELTI